MTHKLQVKEHLRNGALYQPLKETSVDKGWKRRLFRQHAIQKQLTAVLRERTHYSNPFVYIGLPIACILLASSVYFGLLNPGNWTETYAWFAGYEVPPIGLKEVFVFAAIVNGVTFFFKKRLFAL